MSDPTCPSFTIGPSLSDLHTASSVVTPEENRRQQLYRNYKQLERSYSSLQSKYDCLKEQHDRLAVNPLVSSMLSELEDTEEENPWTPFEDHGFIKFNIHYTNK
jgi:hypothetical protein